LKSYEIPKKRIHECDIKEPCMYKILGEKNTLCTQKTCVLDTEDTIMNKLFEDKVRKSVEHFDRLERIHTKEVLD